MLKTSGQIPHHAVYYLRKSVLSVIPAQPVMVLRPKLSARATARSTLMRRDDKRGGCGLTARSAFPQDAKKKSVLNPFHTCVSHNSFVSERGAAETGIFQQPPLRASLSKQPQDGGVDIWMWIFREKGEKKK